MSCAGCLSSKQTELSTEINIHFQGFTYVGDPGIFVFPRVLVCLDCGLSQFVIAEGELSQIVERSGKRQGLRVVAPKKMRRIVGTN
jgi:hypothetical protein